jgi:hypothetical protein
MCVFDVSVDLSSQEIFMKKFAFALLAAAILPTSVFAATSGAACTTGNPVSGGITGDATKFVAVTFNPKCSANVSVSYDQNATAFWAGSVSSKGKSLFSGSSSGGAVANSGACTAASCSTTDLAAALANAVTACGSYCQ